MIAARLPRVLTKLNGQNAISTKDYWRTVGWTGRFKRAGKVRNIIEKGFHGHQS